MSRLQRIGVFISGLLMLLGAAVRILNVEDGLMFITTVLAVSLFVMGIRIIVYFLTMARHMVGGKAMLFAGVFLLDFGFFTSTMFDESRLMIILYLAGWHAFSGLVSLLRAREARKYKGHWKLSAVYGIGNIAVAIFCLIFSKSAKILTGIYCAGLVYSAGIRMISSFRRTEIVFIQ